MLAFFMIKLEITVGIGQRVREVAITGPVGDIMHVQEGVLPFMQNG